VKPWTVNALWNGAELALVLAVVLALIWDVVRRFRGVKEASCAQCGYLVTGLPGFICPECGSDLRDGGIRLPGERRPMPRWLGVIIHTLLFMALVLFVWPSVERMLPRWYSGVSWVEMGLPPSEEYEKVVVIVSGGGWSPQIKFDEIKLTIVPLHGDERRLVVKDPGELTPQRVLEWMSGTIKNPDRATVKMEAASIAEESARLMSEDWSVFRSGVSRTPFRSLKFQQRELPSRIPAQVSVPVGCVIFFTWMIGVVYICRRRGVRVPAPRGLAGATGTSR
jgi:hypothetical protein